MTTENSLVQQLLVNVPDYIQRVQCDTISTTKPFKCAVKSCKNKFRSYKERNKYPYKFHEFPNDSDLCKKWKKKCGLEEGETVKNLMVCSDHFNLDDYSRNYKAEFINPNFRRHLKKNVVPSQNLIGPEVILSDSEDKEKYENSESPMSIFNKAVEDNIALKDTYCALVNEKNKLQEGIETNKKMIRNVKLAVQNSKINRCSLAKIFSPAQIELLQGKNKKVYWSDDDLATAFTIRHMGGKECYLYLKNSLGLPLPALSCVQKWAAACSSEQ